MEGRWWRFDRYEIRDGHVVPAPGAVLEEYSFFDELERSKQEMEKGTRGRWDGPAPHVEFANLSDDESILAWVHRFGLLGILPHLMRQARFSNGVVFTKNWITGGWDADPDLTTTEGFEALAAVRNEGATLYGRPPGMVTMAYWDGGEHTVPAEREFGRYFLGGVPKNGYPKPLSEEFWHYYSESLEEIRMVISDLREVFMVYRTDKDQDVPWYTAQRVQSWLNANASARLMAPRPGERVTRLHADTLIGMLATLTLLTVGEKDKISLCARRGCGRIVVSSLESTAYCSERCKNTAQQRRRRKNQATSIRLFQQGLPFEEIAKHLERDSERDLDKEIESVKRWVAAWLYKSGASPEEIAQKINVDLFTVQFWLDL